MGKKLDKDLLAELVRDNLVPRDYRKLQSWGLIKTDGTLNLTVNEDDPPDKFDEVTIPEGRDVAFLGRIQAELRVVDAQGEPTFAQKISLQLKKFRRQTDDFPVADSSNYVKYSHPYKDARTGREYAGRSLSNPYFSDADDAKTWSAFEMVVGRYVKAAGLV